MWFLLTISSFILTYLTVSYFFLIRKEKRIKIFRQKLEACTDKRFYLFENLINKAVNLINYEQTFLKEIVQLRSQAQKFKQEQDYRAAFFCEERISQLASQINVLFNEFPVLNRIDESEKIQKDILEMEEFLLGLKKEYNILIIKYNRMKSSSFNVPITHMVERFDEKIEPWNITI